MRAGLLVLALTACSRASTPPPEAPVEAAPGAVLRPFAPTHDGAPVLAGIAYGPHRAGQRPGGPDPSPAQILEDLRLLSDGGWHLIRVYGSRGPTPDLLTTIRQHELPLQVVLGAWISGDDPEADAAEVEAAIHLATTFPDQVVAVAVGNETQVDWSAHRSSPEALVRWLDHVRSEVAQPVTTADDYNFWNKPEALPVAEHVDFVLAHAHPLWNGQTLDQAVPWTFATLADLEARHPERPVVLGEVGWSTGMNPDGRETEHVREAADEAAQARFFGDFRERARAEGLPYFWFEAFDEPWKGTDDPREIEKHWGLWREDRTPKPALLDGP